MAKVDVLDFQFTELPAKEKPSKIKDFAMKYFYSYWYLFICGLAVVIGWATNIPDISFFILCINIAFCLFALDDITPLLGIIFMFPTALPKNASADTVAYLAVYLIPVIIGVFYHIIKFKPLKRLGKWFLPQVAVSIALIMGGLGSNLTPDKYAGGLVQGLGLGLGSLAVYELIINYTKIDNYDFRLFFAKMCGAISVLYAVQVFILVFLNPWGLHFNEITHSMVDVGGVKSNALSHMMLMTVPFLVYHAMRQPKTMVIHLLLSFFVCGVSIFTYSRGCMLMLIFLGPIMYITALVLEKKHKGKMASVYCVVIAVLIILCVIFREKIASIIDGIVHMRDNSSLDSFSSGRVTLYREARLLFQSYPLFGTGLGYTSPSIYQYDSTITFLWFHSTFWQVLASTGLFGFCMYAYNYYVRFKMVFKNIKNDLFNVCILFCFAAFEIYSLIDANSFLPLPFMFFVAMVTAFQEKSNEQHIVDEENKEMENYTYLYN